MRWLSLLFRCLPLYRAVTWYRLSIFETHPWETRSWREMTHGRTPAAANSTIFRRMWLGRGLPLMKTPPSWLTLPWPARGDKFIANLPEIVAFVCKNNPAQILARRPSGESCFGRLSSKKVSIGARHKRSLKDLHVPLSRARVRCVAWLEVYFV